MNALKTLMLTVTLIVVSGVIDAGPATPIANNMTPHQMRTATPMNEEQEVDYLKLILANGGLYALVLALNNEVPEVAKAVEFVALFKKLDSANHLLIQILVQLKKNNHLLNQSMLHKGVAMDG